MKSLKTLNQARRLRVSEGDNGVKLSERYAVGLLGEGGGDRAHLLFVESVTDPGETTVKVGDIFAARSACNSQTHGVVVDQRDLKDINCVKCQKILARIKGSLKP